MEIENLLFLVITKLGGNYMRSTNWRINYIIEELCKILIDAFKTNYASTQQNISKAELSSCIRRLSKGLLSTESSNTLKPEHIEHLLNSFYDPEIVNDESCSKYLQFTDIFNTTITNIDFTKANYTLENDYEILTQETYIRVIRFVENNGFHFLTDWISSTYDSDTNTRNDLLVNLVYFLIIIHSELSTIQNLSKIKLPKEYTLFNKSNVISEQHTISTPKFINLYGPINSGKTSSLLKYLEQNKIRYAYIQEAEKISSALDILYGVFPYLNKDTMSEALSTANFNPPDKTLLKFCEVLPRKDSAIASILKEIFHDDTYLVLDGYLNASIIELLTTNNVYFINITCTEIDQHYQTIKRIHFDNTHIKRNFFPNSTKLDQQKLKIILKNYPASLEVTQYIIKFFSLLSNSEKKEFIDTLKTQGHFSKNMINKYSIRNNNHLFKSIKNYYSGTLANSSNVLPECNSYFTEEELIILIFIDTFYKKADTNNSIPIDVLLSYLIDKHSIISSFWETKSHTIIFKLTLHGFLIKKNKLQIPHVIIEAFNDMVNFTHEQDNAWLNIITRIALLLKGYSNLPINIELYDKLIDTILQLLHSSEVKRKIYVKEAKRVLNQASTFPIEEHMEKMNLYHNKKPEVFSSHKKNKPHVENESLSLSQMIQANSDIIWDLLREIIFYYNYYHTLQVAQHKLKELFTDKNTYHDMLSIHHKEELKIITDYISYPCYNNWMMLLKYYVLPNPRSLDYTLSLISLDMYHKNAAIINAAPNNTVPLDALKMFYQFSLEFRRRYSNSGSGPDILITENDYYTEPDKPNFLPGTLILDTVGHKQACLAFCYTEATANQLPTEDFITKLENEIGDFPNWLSEAKKEFLTSLP